MIAAPRATAGFLATLNPISRLAVTALHLVPVILSYDPYTPLPFIAILLLQVLLLGGVPPRRFLRTLLPLCALPVGLFLMNLFLSQTGDSLVLLRILFLEVRAEAALRAVTLSLRSLALIAISVGYILVTDPLELVNALMQNAGLSPRVGFSIYVAWNAIPSLREDMKRIESAHMIRLKGRRRSLRDALPAAVTLLAGAIRHAERAAISMASRGLERANKRSYLAKSLWRARDTLYIAGSVAVFLAITIVMLQAGLFVFGLG